MKNAICCLMLVMLAGCFDSPRTTFYTLDPLPATVAPPDYRGPPLALDAVSLPPELERRELVLHLDRNQVEVRGSERWLSPLDRLLRSTLAVDLALRLGEDRVLLPGQVLPGGGHRTLSVALSRLRATDDGTVELAGRWSLHDDEVTLASGQERVVQPITGITGEAIARGFEAAVAAFADRVATGLARVESTGIDLAQGLETSGSR